MTLIVDAAPIVAAADVKDKRQAEVERVLRAEAGALVIPAPVTAEVDYLLGVRLGETPRHAFLADLAAGRFMVANLELGDYARALDLDRRYAGLQLGLADLSIVILAERFETLRLLTFDERDFRAIRSLVGDPFTILPADA